MDSYTYRDNCIYTHACTYVYTRVVIHNMYLSIHTSQERYPYIHTYMSTHTCPHVCDASAHIQSHVTYICAGCSLGLCVCVCKPMSHVSAPLCVCVCVCAACRMFCCGSIYVELCREGSIDWRPSMWRAEACSCLPSIREWLDTRWWPIWNLMPLPNHDHI